MIGLSKVAALEYADVGSASSGGVTVNCICPGWVDTALVAPQIAERRAQLGVTNDAAIEAMLSEKQPSHRLSTPGDCTPGGVALRPRRAQHYRLGHTH